eukprot:m.186810 g.186810  ORF g.186810 m.186810 type:complete len:86 (+) comp32282_c1_seq2:2055-2312(+)
MAGTAWHISTGFTVAHVGTCSLIVEMLTVLNPLRYLDRNVATTKLSCRPKAPKRLNNIAIVLIYLDGQFATIFRSLIHRSASQVS